MSNALPASGSADVHRMMLYDAQKKSTGMAYALWFFFGMVGAHRFYAGKTGSGVAMAVTFGVSCLLLIIAIGLLGFIVLGIWALVDAFLIPGWISGHNARLIGSLNH